MASEFNAPDGDLHEEAAMSGTSAAASAAAPGAAQRQLMAMDGVEGVGSGENANGEPVHIVYVRDEEARRKMPKTLAGRDVQVEVTGPIRAL